MMGARVPMMWIRPRRTVSGTKWSRYVTISRGPSVSNTTLERMHGRIERWVRRLPDQFYGSNGVFKRARPARRHEFT